ncbi:MAG TPA: tetratricopeptide repeat protein [Flavobacteriales bacterium]|nr:tetratricopeptide repeat protein [Flavobacteriales bacterium]HRQ84444.1 tetratricopeptide repeat protein [Flavobacteriales bacterium]
MERLIASLLLAMAIGGARAQEADRSIRKGNNDYAKGDLNGAIDAYSHAGEDPRALFNLGNAHYRQDSAAAAQRTFENAASIAKGPQAQARAYHNLGNSWMKQQNFQEAINAYKEALKRSPNDADTRYNLAYAQKKLAQQQQQQQQQQQGGQDNKDQKDQDKQDQKGKDQQDKGQQDKNDPQQGDQPKEQQQEQQRQERIDPQDAKRMLDAAQQQEQDVQDKVRQLMQPKPATPPEKDW